MKKRVNLLVLCATDETVASGKTVEKVKKWPNIDKNAIFGVYYVNAFESELKPSDNAVIVSVNSKNEDIYPDNFFDIIVDEFCPFNAPNILTMATFQWVHRILKFSGIFIMNDFSGVYENNADFFYESIRDLFCTLNSTDELLEHIKEDFDPDFAEELGEESREEKNPYDYIFRKYINLLVTDHYENYLNGERRILTMGDKKIANIEELREILEDESLLFEISSEIVSEEHHIILKK